MFVGSTLCTFTTCDQPERLLICCPEQSRGGVKLPVSRSQMSLYAVGSELPRVLGEVGLLGSWNARLVENSRMLLARFKAVDISLPAMLEFVPAARSCSTAA